MSRDAERREYWREQMQEAHEFMRSAARQTLAECGEALEPLEPAATAAGARVTFSSRPHSGGAPRRFHLRTGLVESFVAAALEFNEHGIAMHVEDGYRSPAMQAALASDPAVVRRIAERVSWEEGGGPPTAALVLRRLGALIATTPKVGTHVSGSAIDISLFDFEGRELSRGAPYLELSELTPMESPYVPVAAREVRALATQLMASHGFVAYPYEFWHYSAGDVFHAVITGSDEPVRYGPIDFSFETWTLDPVAEPDRPLVRLTGGKELVLRSA